MLSPLVQQLVDSLRFLPGVGPKSAQRMAFQLLERGRDQGFILASTLNKALKDVGHCQRCRNFSELAICSLCANQKRNRELLCVVESPTDIIALEQTASFSGTYFVLMGHLSPLEGIQPADIHIPQLIELIKKENIREVILATNPTVEGEATAHYISNQLSTSNCKCSRIAHGVPLDGELSYLDSGTLARALSARTEVLHEE